LVIYNGDHYVLDVPIKDYSLILKTFDLNRDGVNELLLGNVYAQSGTTMQSAELVDINKGKARVLRDFGTVIRIIVEQMTRVGRSALQSSSRVLLPPANSPIIV